MPKVPGEAGVTRPPWRSKPLKEAPMSTLTIDRELDVPAVQKPSHHGRQIIVAIAAVVVIGAGFFVATRSNGKPVVATVQTVEKEFQIGLDASTAPAGHIKVTVQNGGSVTHELVAFKTD